MRSEDLSRLEAAVRDANPLPQPSDLIGSDQSAAVALLIQQGTDRPSATLQRPEPITSGSLRRSSRRWVKPVVVFVAACLLVLGVVGGVLLLSNGQPNFIDEPSPSTTTAPLLDEPAAYDVGYVSVAPNGSLWAAADGGVVRWDVTSGTPTVYTTDDGLPADGAFRVVVGSDGTVWSGGSGWIARFDGSWTTFSAPRSEGPMAVGPDGAVWTAFGERDLSRFDGSGWQTFEVPVSLDQGVAVPWTAFLDVAVNGTVWAGTHGSQGVFAFDGADWAHYTSDDGLPAPLSGTVAAAPDGTVWVGSVSVDGSPGAGVARFDGSTWTVFTTAEGLLDDVPDVAVGADGTVWAIHQNGVSRFDGDTWTAFPDVSGMGMFASVDATGTLWMPAWDGGVIGFDGVDITRLEMPARETASPTTTMAGPAGTWNPILTTTQAGPVPPAATCPPGTDPDVAGPADQERPAAGWTGNLAAAFDQHAGRIVYVDTLGETWTFDVCTNTWLRMNPTGALIGELSAGLVYDVDSDVTVALGYEHISVYDANTNTWTQPSNDTIGLDDGRIVPMGAAYDPISGLILTTRQVRWNEQAENAGYWEVWAYDVDTNDWTLIGTVPFEPSQAQRQGNDTQWLELLGYSQMIDRLIFESDIRTTVLVDPRTGEATPSTTDTPVVDLGWPGGVYGPADDTVYVKLGGEDICGFDTSTLTWSACFDTPADLQNNLHIVFAAMVGDPINQRLILINGIGGDWWSEATKDIWAINLATGEWTQLLAPSSP